MKKISNVIKSISVLSMLALAACGKPGSNGGGQPVSVTPTPKGYNYTMQAHINEPGDVKTDASVSVSGTITVPDHADALQNATDAGSATLTFDGGQCYYRNATNSSYYGLTFCTGGFVAGSKAVTTALNFGLQSGYYNQSATVSITIAVQ